MPAFPHFVIVLDTTDLRDEECTICNFNIAVSRPAYPGVRGGNHDRRTAPTKISEHWRRFRDSNPSKNKLRSSYWHVGLDVPVLAGKQITENPAGVGCKTNTPELLIRGQYTIPAAVSFVVFSEFDLATARLIPGIANVKKTNADGLEWYAALDRVADEVRGVIKAYFKDADAQIPANLDFDQIRPKKVNAHQSHA